jgi:hypothetical protein
LWKYEHSCSRALSVVLHFASVHLLRWRLH